MMFKIICYLSIFCVLVANAEVKRKRRETINNRTVLKWTYQHQNRGSSTIDVRLRNLSLPTEEETADNNSLHTGVLEILLPTATSPLFLCHPENNEEYRSAYIFSHIVCRQLGYMSVLSFSKKKLSPIAETPRPLYGLRPNSHRCSGQESSVSMCDWNEVTIADCSTFTEISCGECHSTVQGTSGIIKSPGYPLAYLYDVTCEWNIVVPEDHSIFLTARHLEKTEKAESSTSFCGLQKPYVEIVYETQQKLTIERHCNLEDVKNISIPAREVRVRIFTGFFSPNHVFQSQDRGMAINFEGRANAKTKFVPWKAISISLFVLIFLSITAIFHYCKRHNLCYTRTRQTVLPTVNMPTQAELNRAYEFQRCRIQAPLRQEKGLRLRSIGSGEKFKGFLPPNQPGTNFISASNLPTIPATYVVTKACPKHPVPVETPRMVIPEIILNDGMSDVVEQDTIDRVRTKLVDRFSSNSSKDSDVSVTGSTNSPVFYPAMPSFQIYRSVSSDSDEKPPPYQTNL